MKTPIKAKKSCAKVDKPAPKFKAPAAAPLFVAPAFDPANVRRGAVVRLADAKGEGRVVATGTYRIRIQPNEGASFVVLRSAVSRIVTPAPAAKKGSGKKKPRMLKLAADASIEQISDAFIGWVESGVPAELVKVGLEVALRRLGTIGRK